MSLLILNTLVTNMLLYPVASLVFPVIFKAMPDGAIEQEGSLVGQLILWMQAAAGIQSDDRRARLTAASDAKVELITPVVNPGQPIELRAKNPRDGDPNDVAVVALLHGVKTVESRVKLGLIGKILGTVAYNELRTVRQLGYVVQGGASSFSNASCELGRTLKSAPGKLRRLNWSVPAAALFQQTSPSVA